jgi:hypothetical protein
MRVLHRLWADEAGFVVSTELVLVATILVIGLVVGLATVRDALVQELGDVAMAIGNVNQSYIWDGITGHTSAVAGSDYDDETDFCDVPDDTPALEPGCIDVHDTDGDDEGTAIAPVP